MTTEEDSAGNKKFTADPTKIKYEFLTHENLLASDVEERAKYGEKNRDICEAINNGARFSVLCRGMENHPRSSQQFVSVAYDFGGPGDAFYAMIELEDGRRMPLPILEDAIGNHLIDQSFVKVIKEEDGAFANGKGCTREEFENWIKSVFGEQCSEISY